LYDFRTFKFGAGSHETREQGMCIMEAVAYVAGEAHTDHPKCACPVISALLRSWNDALPFDEDRQRLLGGFVFRLVGTKATEDIEEKRRMMSARWFITVFTPSMLDLIPRLKEHAKALRKVNISNGKENNILDVLTPARDAACQASWVALGDDALWYALDAAWEAAWEADTSGFGAFDAAWDISWDAAWDATRVATVDALGDVAWDAARNAAKDAVRNPGEEDARDNAWNAARNALGNTVRDAAWVAVSDATGNALGDSAWDDAGSFALGNDEWEAAKDALGFAGMAAAGYALKDAAWDVREDVALATAWAALSPTIIKIQRSAKRLVDRMIRLTEPRERKICQVKQESVLLVPQP
jgi:hypothetical protein